MTIKLEPMAGDPDLYVWFPHNTAAPNIASNAETGSDQVSFIAPHAGEYLVEVQGYVDSDYTLTATLNGATVVPGHSHTKSTPASPSVSGTPSNLVTPAIYRVFLPLAQRGGN